MSIVSWACEFAVYKDCHGGIPGYMSISHKFPSSAGRNPQSTLAIHSLISPANHTTAFVQSWLQHPGFSVKVSLKRRMSQVESKSSITFLGFAETSARDALLNVCGL